MKKKKVALNSLSFKKENIMVLNGQAAIFGGGNPNTADPRQICDLPSTTVDGTRVETNQNTCPLSCIRCVSK